MGGRIGGQAAAADDCASAGRVGVEGESPANATVHVAGAGEGAANAVPACPDGRLPGAGGDADAADAGQAIVDTPAAAPPERAPGSAPAFDTDEFYASSCERGFVKLDAIARNLAWATQTRWGEMEITINLSKPEKDPRDIAAAAWQGAGAGAGAGEIPPAGGASAANPIAVVADARAGVHSPAAGGDARFSTGESAGGSGRSCAYVDPATGRTRPCPLCVDRADLECGYARELRLGGERWALWFSPYAYYDEHCIAMSWEHRPMHVDRSTFEALFELVDLLPGYFFGSNADLPLVGGSILAHDHFQGGRHVFPMQCASLAEGFDLASFPEVEAGIVKWPVTVVRLRGRCRAQLVDAACALLDAWCAYDDAQVGIVSGSAAHLSAGLNADPGGHLGSSGHEEATGAGDRMGHVACGEAVSGLEDCGSIGRSGVYDGLGPLSVSAHEPGIPAVGAADSLLATGFSAADAAPGVPAAPAADAAPGVAAAPAAPDVVPAAPAPHAPAPAPAPVPTSALRFAPGRTAAPALFSEGAPKGHNTLTPILCWRDGAYQLDLALRCNVASPDRPFGVFHPHEGLHHIKKENIGLIEVMGRAILPARVRDVMRERGLSRDDVGKLYAEVLECAGVFKWDAAGRRALHRFIGLLV